MQKLKFINSNGVEIDLTTGDFGITNWNGFSNVGLNLQTQQVPFNDGSVFLDSLLSNREINITLAINDDNNLEKRYRLRRELIAALNPKLGEGVLIYTNNFLSKRIKAIPQVPLFETHNSNMSGTPKASLTWVCPDPYWEDLEETSVFLKPNERINIKYNGEVETKPIISFWGTSTNPRLKNINNKTEFLMNGEVSDFLADLSFGHKSFNKQKLYFSTLANINGFKEVGENQILYGQSVNNTKDFMDFNISLNPTGFIQTMCVFSDGIVLAGGNGLYVSYDKGETWAEVTLPESGLIVTALIIQYENTHVFYVVLNYKIYKGAINTQTKTFTFEYITDLPTVPSCWVRAKDYPDSYILFCDNIQGNIVEFDTNRKLVNIIETDANHKINSIILSSEDNYYYCVGNNGFAKKTDLLTTGFTPTWSTIMLSSEEKLTCIYYDDNSSNYFICGNNGALYVGRHQGNNYSWANKTYDTVNRNSIGYSNLFGQIQVVGADILIYKDGNFVPVIKYPTNALSGVKFKNKYYAGGIEGEIYVSEDFKIWSEIFRSENVTKPLYFAEETLDHELCFFTKDGDIIYTTDGVNFSIKKNILIQLGGPSEISTLCYFNEKYYIGAGSNKRELYESTDRMNWSKVDGFSSNNTIESIFTIDLIVQNQPVKYLIIINDTGKAYYSLDGVTFSMFDFESANMPWGVYNNNIILVGPGFSTINEISSETFESTTLYSYLDFLTQEEIEQGAGCYLMPFVSNNHLFISVFYLRPSETTWVYSCELYLADNELSLIFLMDNVISLQVVGFYNNEYIMNIMALTPVEGEYNLTMDTEFNVDFDSRQEGGVVLNEGNYYLKKRITSSDYKLYKNNIELGKFADNEIVISHDLIIYTNDDNRPTFSSSNSFGSLGSPFNFSTENDLRLIIKYEDGIYCFINSYVYYLKSMSEINRVNYHYKDEVYDYWDSISCECFCIYGNKLFAYRFDSSTSAYIWVFEKISETKFELLERCRIDGQAYRYSAIENLACIGNGAYFVFGIEGYIISIDIFNNIIYKISKSTVIYEFINKNGVMMGIGNGGFVLCEGQNISEIYHASFIFTRFIHEDYDKFVGLLNSFGNVEFKLDENIVSSVNDISFVLSVGDNNITLLEDSGYMTATIQYRQRYIGV